MSLDEERQFEEARKQLVVKRVDAIQLGRNSFTLVEQKAVTYMISKIKPDDQPSTEYLFNIREFCRMIQWHRTPTSELLDMLQNLASKSWWVKSGVDGKAEYELKHWFDIVRLNEGKGTITITFSQTVYPYLFNLLEQQRQGKAYLASWTTDAISLMKNKFSPRIFELLRTYQFNNKKWEFENGTGTERDLQMIVADRDDRGNPLIPKGWSNWHTFKRDVLDPAKEEINKYTDLMIDYEGLKTDFSGKKYRRFVRLVFMLDEKTEEEKERKDMDIAIAYDNVISEQDYEQMSLLDYMNSENDFESKRKMIRKLSEEREREKRINKSKHPAFLVEMEEKGFDEKYIDQLYNVAKMKFFSYSSVVDSINEELWIIDYVELHLSSMRASGIDTISSEKARLYDLVENDYKHYAEIVTSKYYNGNVAHEKPVSVYVNKEPEGTDMMNDSDAELAELLLNKLKPTK